MKRPATVGYIVMSNRSPLRWVRSEGRLCFAYPPHGAATCFPTRDAARAAIEATTAWENRKGFIRGEPREYDLMRIADSH